MTSTTNHAPNRGLDTENSPNATEAENGSLNTGTSSDDRTDSPVNDQRPTQVDPKKPPVEFETGLPSPYEFPMRDVVIFDGDCRFCFKQVRRLHSMDRKSLLSFVSLHDPYVGENYAHLSHQQLMDEMYVVTRQGKTYGGAAAFRYLTRKLPMLWILAPLLHIPGSLKLWQWGYRQVAKRRYKISAKMGDQCESGSCDIHFK